MDELELRKVIYDSFKEICHLSQMQVFATSYYQKNYFQVQMDEKLSGMIDHILEYANRPAMKEYIHMNQQEGTGTREFTPEELAFYDGSNGKEAYVAMNGNVYNMTMVLPWAGGTHHGMVAGKDLTKQFMGCHMGMLQILEKVPKVGILRAPT